jgi:hypothetical protein
VVLFLFTEDGVYGDMSMITLSEVLLEEDDVVVVVVVKDLVRRGRGHSNVDGKYSITS